MDWSGNRRRKFVHGCSVTSRVYTSTRAQPGTHGRRAESRRPATTPFVLRLSKDERRFAADEGSWFESLTTNGAAGRAVGENASLGLAWS